MRYNRLGNTGLMVSELCLGAMTFGQTQGDRFSNINGLDQDASTALVKQAVDAGINMIDTANVYSRGQSEQMVGGALKALGLARSDMIVATKAMGTMGEGPNDSGAGRKHLLDQIDASLTRLGLDHVDLYQIHGFDQSVPMDETLEALNDIVRSGRARYIGVSNWAAWQIAKALGIAERKGWAKYISVQAYYTMAGRDLERELAPMLTSEGLGLMVWSPLAGGLLSGKYNVTGDGAQGEGRRAAFDFPPVDTGRAGPLLDAMRAIADRRGASVAQVAIAWLLYRPVVSTVIVGAKRADQLADNIGACDVELERADMDELDRLSALPGEYPGWMLELQGGYTAAKMADRRQPR